jgi:hypothetical protein
VNQITFKNLNVFPETEPDLCTYPHRRRMDVKFRRALSHRRAGNPKKLRPSFRGVTPLIAALRQCRQDNPSPAAG